MGNLLNATLDSKHALLLCDSRELWSEPDAGMAAQQEQERQERETPGRRKHFIQTPRGRVRKYEPGLVT
jgi:hypothetical protein